MMLLPFVILFCVILLYRIKVSDNEMQRSTDAFWERENEANHVRKKSLSDLTYISFDEAVISDIQSDDKEITGLLADIKDIIGQPILNLNYISNTDLKLTYGSANLPYLSECDARFMNLIEHMSRLGRLLLTGNNETKAYDVIMYNIKLGSDITADYETMHEHFIAEDNKTGLDELVMRASLLNSFKKDIILKKLKS